MFKIISIGSMGAWIPIILLNAQLELEVRYKHFITSLMADVIRAYMRKRHG